MESPSPTISLLVPFWNVPLRAMFRDCGHQEMGDDSVVTVSGRTLVWERPHPPQAGQANQGGALCGWASGGQAGGELKHPMFLETELYVNETPDGQTF